MTMASSNGVLGAHQAAASGTCNSVQLDADGIPITGEPIDSELHATPNGEPRPSWWISQAECVVLYGEEDYEIWRSTHPELPHVSFEEWATEGHMMGSYLFHLAKNAIDLPYVSLAGRR